MKRLILFLVLLACAAPVSAGYVAYESYTIAGTAVGFTTATIVAGSGHPQANRAVCGLETAEIRYTVDGSTTPTASVGQVLEPYSTLTFSNPQDIVNFKAIRTTSTSGVLTCHFYN